MASFWLAPVSEENWLVCREKLLYGVPEGMEYFARKARPGDVLIFYVTKRGSKHLGGKVVGAFRVASEWFEGREPLWPDELREGRAKYRLRARIEPVAEGAVDLVGIADRLPRLSRGGRLNPNILYGEKEIPPEEARVILEALSGSPVAVPSGHEAIKKCLVWLGELLAFYPEPEVPPPDDLYRYDVVWRDNPAHAPLKVFEVVETGQVDMALVRLKHAWDVWRVPQLFLIVSGEQKRERALQLVEPRLRGSFAELTGKVEVYTSADVERLCQDLKKHEDILRKLARRS